MDKKINRTVKKYIDSVAREQHGLISAYLFGSYAKSKQQPDSDIDIALVIENLPDSDRFNTQVKLMILASKIDTRIEPHPISKEDIISNNPFAQEILRTGIELKIN